MNLAEKGWQDSPRIECLLYVAGYNLCEGRTVQSKGDMADLQGGWLAGSLLYHTPHVQTHTNCN